MIIFSKLSKYKKDKCIFSHMWFLDFMYVYMCVGVHVFTHVQKLEMDVVSSLFIILSYFIILTPSSLSRVCVCVFARVCVRVHACV